MYFIDKVNINSQGESFILKSNVYCADFWLVIYIE